MEKTIQIRVDKKLFDLLTHMQKDLAEKIKKEYKLEKITIYGTAVSKLLAEQFNNNKEVIFKINKKNQTQGSIEII